MGLARTPSQGDTLEVRADLGSMLAPGLLSPVLSERTAPNTKTNTMSFCHKHFRFIVAFIEYISPSVEKTCLTSRNLLVNSSGKRARIHWCYAGLCEIHKSALLSKSLRSRERWVFKILSWCTVLFLTLEKRSIYSLLS